MKWSIRRLTRISIRAGSGSRNRLRFYASCGLNPWLPTRDAGIRSRMPGSSRCRSSGRSQSGSEGRSKPRSSGPARLGDGWLPNFRSYADAQTALVTIRRTLEKAGRDPAAFGIEPRLAYGEGNPAGWVSEMKNWRSAGATGFSFNTMKAGFDTPAAHLAALKKFMEAVSSLS